MGQRNPSIPGSPVSPPVPRSSHRSLLVRLLIVFALGLTSSLLFSPVGVGPWWWQPITALIVLLLATLFSEVLDREGHNHSSAGRLLRGPVVACVVIGGLGVAFLALRQVVQAAGSTQEARQAALSMSILAAVLVAVLVGLATAIVAQRRPRVPLAIGGAALGWLGASIANVLMATFGPAAQNPEGVGTTLVIAVVLSIVGLAIALLGGLLGWGLRTLAVMGRT